MVAQQDCGHETIGFGANGRRMSVVEFESPGDWDEAYRYELLDGVLIVSPAPAGAERHPNDHLGYLLRRYQEISQFGCRLDDTVFEHDVRTSRGIRRVDRAVWIGLGRPPKLKKDVPAILVEFVSEGRRNAYRDYVEKRDEYVAIGVKEYWVIDRFDRTMTVFSGATAEPLVVREPDTYSTPLLPEFELPLVALLKIADQYSE